MLEKLPAVIGWLAHSGYLYPIAVVFILLGFMPPIAYILWFKRNCPYCDAIFKAKRGNKILGLFIGRDGYSRLYPMKSDGNTATPEYGPLKGKTFVVRSKSVKRLGPVNFAIFLTDYAFPLEPKYCVAAGKLKELFKSIKPVLDEIVAAFNARREKKRLLEEKKALEEVLDKVAKGEIEADDKQIAELEGRLNQINRLLELSEKARPVEVCGEQVEPEEIRDWLVYDHSPSYIEEYATARENIAYMRAAKAWRSNNLLVYALVFTLILIGAGLAFSFIMHSRPEVVILGNQTLAHAANAAKGLFHLIKP